MIFLAFTPVILYFLLEFFRHTPIREEKQNRGSSVLLGAVLTWMIILPAFLHFVSDDSQVSLGMLYNGILIGILGLWIRFSAIAMLGRFYSRNVGIQSKHELIQTGWYRFIRHPGYLGTLLTFLGFAVATGSWLSAAVNVVLFFIAYSYRIKVEEAALSMQFGECYGEYRQRTWRLIPFIY